MFTATVDNFKNINLRTKEKETFCLPNKQLSTFSAVQCCGQETIESLYFKAVCISTDTISYIVVSPPASNCIFSFKYFLTVVY